MIPLCNVDGVPSILFTKVRPLSFCALQQLMLGITDLLLHTQQRYCVTV
jgi:hypothetical protein